MAEQYLMVKNGFMNGLNYFDLNAAIVWQQSINLNLQSKR